MKINIDGKSMEGTATQLVDFLREQAWDAEEYKSTEEYLEALKGTYQRMCNEELKLPEGDTDTKCQAAIKALAEIRILKIEEE